MHAATAETAATAGIDRAAPWWHLLLIVALSAGYEALFLERSNGELFDEGWPLYAAMRLHAGGVLYRDVFFVFPPGHVWPAWLAYWLDPPGIVLARAFYAAFNVGLCVALYFLGRRIMPARYALFSALLVAVAAPHSHMGQLLFGYRFLLFSVLALLAFARWLDGGKCSGRGDRKRAWLLLAGAWTGVALLFRVTPAFAVSCGIGLALWSAQSPSPASGGGGGLRGLRPQRDTWLGGCVFAGGLLLVVAPALLWFANSVGLSALWQENVLRVMGLQQLQSLPVPSLALPDFGDRKALHYWFAGAQYWAYTVMFAGYGIALLVAWWRSAAEGRAFAHPLLLAITLWGGVFLLRTLGRSDDHHLNSALPPACLLLGHLAALAWQRFAPAREIALLAAAFVAWLVVQGHDRHFAPLSRGLVPIEAGSDSPEEGLKVAAEQAELERLLRVIRQTTDPTDTILDLSASPLLHPMSGRHAVGEFDIFMPGTFLDDAEEERFVARLEARPPAMVIWPGWPFDSNPERAVQRTAPRVSRWVKERYRPRDKPATSHRFVILVPR